jgi:hypothetical protein
LFEYRQAALDCGIPAEDLKTFIEMEAQQRERDRSGWARSWSELPSMLPTKEEKEAAAAGIGNADYDIFSTQPIPRSESLDWAGANIMSPVAPSAASTEDESEGLAPDVGVRGGKTKGGAMTKRELRLLAERRNLDYAQLLADAERRDIKLEDC